MKDFFDVPMEIGATYLVPVMTRSDGIQMRMCLLRSIKFVADNYFEFKFEYEKKSSSRVTNKVAFCVGSHNARKCVKLIPRVANNE